jgi:hypothetical protein
MNNNSLHLQTHTSGSCDRQYSIEDSDQWMMMRVSCNLKSTEHNGKVGEAGWVTGSIGRTEWVCRLTKMENNLASLTRQHTVNFFLLILGSTHWPGNNFCVSSISEHFCILLRYRLSIIWTLVKESAARCTVTPCGGYIACLDFTFTSNDAALEVKWLAQGHKQGGMWRVSNPRCSDHEFNSLTTGPHCPKWSNDSGFVRFSKWWLKFETKPLTF